MNTNTAALAADRRAEEDAIWAAEGKRAARRIMAEQVEQMEDHILDALRTSAHGDRSNLVNLYIGSDRKERIEEVDMILSVIEEEQAKRAGLASSADILASFPAVEVQDSAHLAYLLDVDEDEKAPEPERILWDTKIFGAAVTLIAQNPRVSQGSLTEWDLTDGDGTEYGTVFTNPLQDSALALHRRMAREARAYWRSR